VNTPTSPDDLAQHVSNLTISTKPKPKPKSKPSSSSGDGDSTTRVAAAMRAVNAVSQSLSGLVQSGWRAGSGKKSFQAVEAGENASKELRKLRVVCVGDVDVERAASSMVGKLVVLEMVRLDNILLLLRVFIYSLVCSTTLRKLC
jgi:separase